MTKLMELSEQELADLLNLPLDKARKWLEVAKSISDEEEPAWLEGLFGEFESAPSIQHSSVNELMELSIEEVEQLKRTGEFYRRYPYFKREMPEDAETRLRYLRQLLANEVEFAARYPAAYGLLHGAFSVGSGHLLPSFDVRVLTATPVSIDPCVSL
jgi:hypothetical protein